MRSNAAALCAFALLISAWSAPAQGQGTRDDINYHLSAARRDRIAAGREKHPPLVAALCESRLNILNYLHELVESSQGRMSPADLSNYRSLLALERLYSCPPGGPDTPPPPLPPLPVQQEFQQALTRAMNLRASRNCDPARLARDRVRAIIREAERTGTIPPPLLENWKAQLRAEDALACTNPIAIPQTASPCPTSIPAGAMSTNCRCPAGPYRRTVWGSFYYSADSGLCAAAMHAGVIGPQGGSILARVGPRRSYFIGKTRNGVTSLGMGAANRSITFAGASDPVEERRGMVPLCRSQLSVYPAAERRSPITCRCRVGSSEGGVYGSGPYTADSFICTAARHAGALTSQDGLVTVTAAPGLNEYEGSVRNGVTSRRYHAWPESMNVAAATG